MPNLTYKKVFAALPRAERGKAVRLSGTPRELWNKSPKVPLNILYCNGHSVYIRNLQDPTLVDIYTEHSRPTTVARYSPSGFYIVSCDISGKVRIWDTVNPEHILKKEFTPLTSEIRDVDWSPDSQRIVVGGDGREKYAHVFTADMGTSVGELAGHSKSVNTVSYRPSTPFRIVSAGEDKCVAFYEGPPFKFKRTQKQHTNFANVARFSPDGEVVLSGGADGKLCKYDGKTLDESDIMELGSPAHKGGIYDFCFSPDGKKVLTASGDKTAKIFDVESGQSERVFEMGKNWQDMQLGCLWLGEEIITVNGYGHIIYHDPCNTQQPKRVIKGHMKPITAVAVSEDRTTAFTGGQEGIIYWDVKNGNNDIITGKGHTNEVTDMIVSGDRLISVGVDDTLQVSSVSNKEFCDVEIKLDSQPKEVDVCLGTVVVACVKHVIVLEMDVMQQQQQQSRSPPLKKRSVLDVKIEPRCVSIHPGGTSVAVGFMGKRVKIYSLENGMLSEQKEIDAEQDVSCLAYSPDGTYLAFSCDRFMAVVSASDYEPVAQKRERHQARVSCLAWSPDSRHFVTGGLDAKIIVWNATMDYEYRAEMKAFTMSHANKVAWVDNDTIIAVGQDSNVKQFTVTD